jgi:predicted DNA-binding antitoxin AbrB/MazE fold protein
MALTIQAVYEGGVLRPAVPLPPNLEGKHVWVTIHVDAEPDRVEKAYGLLGWTGDADTVRRVALDPEFDVLESP